MTTITKERLLTIKQWRETYGPGSNVVLPAEEAEELARIALASLEAKPIGAFHIAEQQVDGTSDYLKDGEWPIDNGIIEVYAAPPVPVVPEEKPMPNALSMLEREITQLIGDAQEATVTGYELIAEAWRLMDGQDPKTSDWHSKASKYLNSNIVEKVDDDRIEAVKAVLRRLAGNSPVIPGEVLSAIIKVARVRADFDDFDGDRRGIGDCLDEAEQELIVTINKYASQLAVEPVVPAVLERLRTIVADPRALPRRKEWVSGQQYSYVLLENVEAMVDEACHAAMLHGAEPVSQTYNLPELIEGMEVSIDVSTCDADLGNRYFGTVTEALELDTAKNGYILLVQDAEPNFDVNGNSPVTPDGWISCSERMPNEEDVLVYCSDTKEQMVGFHKGKGLFQFFYMNGVEGVCEPSHWMPLPEPPQG